MTMQWRAIGDRDPGGAVLIFDAWANEVQRRLQVWQMPNTNLRFDTVNVADGRVVHSVTLEHYRAEDLQAALGRVSIPPPPPDRWPSARESG